MFNGFNAQHPYGESNYQAWQTGYGNLQGNLSAAAGVHSYHAVGSMFQGQPGPPQGNYATYETYPHQAGWHQTYQPHQTYQQHQAYPYPQDPVAGQPPPLPEGAPPPLPPPPTEEPPPLPPDGPGGPSAPPPPPLPDSNPPSQPTILSEQPLQVPPAPRGDYPHGLAASQSWPPQYGQQHLVAVGPGSAAAAPAWYPHPHQHLPYHSISPPASGMGHAAYGTYQQAQAPAAGPHGFAAPHQPPVTVAAALAAPAATPYLHQRPPGGTAAPLPAARPAGSGPGTTASAAPSSSAVPAAVPAALPPPEPVVIDITRLLRMPHRASRPRRLLLVLRGLPGSGKTTLARKIREAELEAGADPPRLHSIDDYYMQEKEVEVVEEEGGRKKRRKVTELQYVYEPEMEATYFRDLIRAVGRSCEDRRHSFVVIDAPVLRAEQLRELMAVGQRANFECYALRPLESDPAVCAAAGRNVHGHPLERLRELAASWEDAPPLYAQVSAVSLFGGPIVGEEDGVPGSRGDDGDGEIQEVEMDAEDDDSDQDGDRDLARGGDGGEVAMRKATSRWHDDEGDEVFRGSGGADDGSDGHRQQRRKKKKRDKAARLRAAADIDDHGILTGLNDALAAAGRPATAGGSNGGGTTGDTGTVCAALRRGASLHLRSALRTQGPLAEAVAVSAKRRVWWPDLGPGKEQPGGGEGNGTAEQASSPQPAAQESEQQQAGGSKLVRVVYLEGLGPPQELEDLPYGYQRKAPADRVAGVGAGEGVAPAAASAALLRQPGALAADGNHHHNFRDQAKAEHESEHDLFRRLLLGKKGHGRGGWGPSGGGTPLGLFEAVLEDDEEEDG